MRADSRKPTCREHRCDRCADSYESPHGPTDPSKLNSVLAHHIRLSKCNPRSDEVNIVLGEL